MLNFNFVSRTFLGPVVVSLGLFFTNQAHAAFKVPGLQGPVMDLAGVISRQDQRELSALLYDYNQQGKAQIQVVTIPSLEGDAIESVSMQMAEAWKLGGEKSDNGILFLIAVNDRKLRIEVGQGLEGTLPDAYARRIIDEAVVPSLRAGRLSSGVVIGVHSIISYIDKEYAAGKQLDRPTRAKKGLSLSHLGVLFFLMVVVVLGKLGGGGGGGRGIRRHSGYGGGFPIGGGGFGGGGGWSGGGGGFSGGGSSGGW